MLPAQDPTLNPPASLHTSDTPLQTPIPQQKLPMHAATPQPTKHAIVWLDAEPPTLAFDHPSREIVLSTVLPCRSYPSQSA